MLIVGVVTSLVLLEACMTTARIIPLFGHFEPGTKHLMLFREQDHHKMTVSAFCSSISMNAVWKWPQNDEKQSICTVTMFKDYLYGLFQ